MFSIIVSIYNVEKYLRQCIDSILAQIYTNFELILVDDGSTDGCPKICDEYVAQDSRVKVIHKENGGLMSTRKVGVNEANGEYVCFIDGDDFINNDMLSTYAETLGENKVDIVCAGITKYDGESCQKIKQDIPCGMYDKEQLKKDIYPRMLSKEPFYTFYIMPSVCAKCFKKEIVKPIYDNIPENVSIGEDVAATYPALLRADSICVVDYSGYMYRQNMSSMTHTYNTNLYTKLKNLLVYLKDIEKKEACYLKNQVNEYAVYLLFLARNNELLYNKSDSYQQKKKNMDIYLKDALFSEAVKNVKLKGCKKRVELFCFKHRLHFLLYLICKKNG